MHALFDGFIAFWVVVSVLAVILESVQVIHYTLNLHFIVLDAVAVGIFTLEYCFRLYACVEEPRFRKPFSGRFRHATTFGALIDLLAIVPFFLETMLQLIPMYKLRAIGGSGVVVAPVKYVFEEEPPRYKAMLEALK